MIEIAVTVTSAAAAAAGSALLRRRRRTALLDEARSEAERRLNAARSDAAQHQEDVVAEAQARASALASRLREEEQTLAQSIEEEERRLTARSEALDAKGAVLEEREGDLQSQFDALRRRKEELRAAREQLDDIETRRLEAMERLAGEPRDAIRDEIERKIVNGAQITADKAARATEAIVDAAREESARRLIDLACQRYGAALPADRLIATVSLPKPGKHRDALLADDRALLLALTEASEVEFGEPDEGGVMYMNAPDPFTREIARRAYERLARHKKPSEEQARKLVAAAEDEMNKIAHAAGRRAAKLLGVKGVHGDIRFLVGKLLYRTSYTQNQWQHAIECAFLCGMLADDLGMDVIEARRAALMHDIGKVLWAETEATGSHAVSGAAFAAAHGEKPEIVHPIAAHHDDEKPSTPLALIVKAADALSGARPGARRETLEHFTSRVDDLERIAGDFDAVEKSYVIQGGRELRCFVNPHRVSDVDAARISGDIAARIEDEMAYPGQIKVTVIRQTRTSATARASHR